MTSIEFHLRPSRRANGGEGRLFIRVIHDRKSGHITLPYRLYPEEWNESLRRPVIPAGYHSRSMYLREAAAFLEKERGELRAIVNRLETEGVFTVRDILAHYRVKTHPKVWPHWFRPCMRN